MTDKELLAECLRRFKIIGNANSDDWRWYQSQARQNLRAMQPRLEAALEAKDAHYDDRISHD